MLQVDSLKYGSSLNYFNISNYKHFTGRGFGPFPLRIVCDYYFRQTNITFGKALTFPFESPLCQQTASQHHAIKVMLRSCGTNDDFCQLAPVATVRQLMEHVSFSLLAIKRYNRRNVMPFWWSPGPFVSGRGVTLNERRLACFEVVAFGYGRLARQLRSNAEPKFYL